MAYTDLHIEELMFKKAAGTISPAENERLQVELDGNPLARRHWEEIQHRLGTPESSVFLQEHTADQGWKELTTLLERPKSRPKWWQYAAVAAAVIAVAISVFWYYRPSADGLEYVAQDVQKLVPSPEAIQLLPEGGEAINLSRAVATLRVGEMSVTADSTGLRYQSAAAAPHWATLYVPAQQQYRIDLPDGSKVWLNAVSSLRFPSVFGAHMREVYVTGEAYFEVAHDSKRPFIVHAEKQDIRVLGTSFNVNAYEPNRLVTALVSGRVELTTDGQARTTLAPGEAGIFRDNRVAVETFDPTFTLAWMEGIHYFYNAPLQSIAPILSRWYGVDVHFADAEVATRPFSGSIDKHQPLQVFIDNLKAIADIQPEVRDGSLYFR
jgi:transmembrane sensor